MRARDLYHSKGTFTNNLYLLDDFVPEVALENVDFEANRTVRIKVLCDLDYWFLAVVLYGVHPFMVIQRGSNGFKKRFISDLGTYGQMVEYLHLLSGSVSDLIHIDDDLPQLTEFCGKTLEEAHQEEAELRHTREQNLIRYQQVRTEEEKPTNDA